MHNMEASKNKEFITSETFSLPLDGQSTPGRRYLEVVLNKTVKIVISDGRSLIGQFLCTDGDENIILGSCHEFTGNPNDENTEEPRLLGLAMIPGRHVKSMYIDMDKQTQHDIDSVLKNGIAKEENLMMSGDS